MRDFYPYAILRELLSGCEVWLPDIGTLAVVRVGATYATEDGYMHPPYDTLVLDSDQQSGGVDVVSLVATLMQQQSRIGGYFHSDQFYSNAQDAYQRWMEQNLSEDGAMLTVEGVCTIDLRGQSSVFSLFGSFSEMLLPYDAAPVWIGERLRCDVAQGEEPEEEPRECNQPQHQMEQSHSTIESLESIDDSYTRPVAYRAEVPNVQRVSTAAVALASIVFGCAVLYLLYRFVVNL